MLKEYKSFWKNMFNFNGRARRREYWVSYLWNLAIMLILYGILFASVFSCIKFTDAGVKPNPLAIVFAVFIGIITLMFFIAAGIAGIAISVRRCHDIGQKGTTFLFCFLGSFICGIGFIVWLVFCFFDSKEDNEWGVNPKNPEVNEYPDSKGIITGIVVSIVAFILYIIIILVSGLSTAIKTGKSYQENSSTIEQQLGNEYENITVDDVTEENIEVTEEEFNTEITEAVTEEMSEEITDNETENTSTDQSTANFSSKNWLDYELAIDGKIIKLPCTYADIEALGFHLEADDPAFTDELEDNHYTLSYRVIDDKERSFYIRFMNVSGTKKKIVESDIYGLGFDDFFDLPSVEICNGIKLGMSKADVIAIAGEGDYNYVSDDGDYSSIDYYKDGKSYEGKLVIDFNEDVVRGIDIENSTY